MAGSLTTMVDILKFLMITVGFDWRTNVVA